MKQTTIEPFFAFFNINCEKPSFGVLETNFN